MRNALVILAVLEEQFARRVGSADPQAMALLQEEAANLQKESDRRILEAVAGSLDARQVEILRRQFEVKFDLDRAASAGMRGR